MSVFSPTDRPADSEPRKEFKSQTNLRLGAQETRLSREQPRDLARALRAAVQGALPGRQRARSRWRVHLRQPQKGWRWRL